MALVNITITGGIAQLDNIERKIDMANKTILDVAAEVKGNRVLAEQNKALAEKAIALLDTISQRLKDAGPDSVALNSIIEDLDAERAALTAEGTEVTDAVAKDTPVDPTPAV